MSKYKNRQEYITTVSGAASCDNDWANELEKQLEKQAVKSRSVDQSMFEQINSIISGKSKYHSVDAAVQDMQRRSGFLDYQKKKVAGEEKSSKNTKPEIFQKYPHIEETVSNMYSRPTPPMDVNAALEELKRFHGNEVSDGSLFDSNDLAQYLVSREKKTEKNKPKDVNHNFGKQINISNEDADISNADPWAALQPAANTR